jgi:hypothetical protein
MQEVALGEIKSRLSECCEEERTMKLGRGKREPRQIGGQAREIDWQCGECGCRDANHFTRDEHYRRALETGWGVHGGTVSADGGGSMLWARCDLSLDDPGEVWALWLDMDQRCS